MNIEIKYGQLRINNKNTFIRPRVCEVTGSLSMTDKEEEKLHNFFMKNNMVKESTFFVQKRRLG